MAQESVNLSIASWSMDELHAENLEFDLQLFDQSLGFNASADSMTLAAPIGKLSQIKLICKQLRIVSENVSCARGSLAFHQAQLGRQQLNFFIEAIANRQQYKVKIDNVNFANTPFSVSININKQQWTIAIDSSQVSLASLLNALSPYMQQQVQQTLAPWSLDGQLQFSLALNLDDGDLKRLNLDLTGAALNISDQQGLYVSEDLANTLSLAVEKRQDDWHWQSTLNINKGQAYAEPIFIDFTTMPLSIDSQGSWAASEQLLTINDMQVNHKDIMQLSGDLTADSSGVKQLHLQLAPSNIANLYAIWLQPFMLGNSLDALELTGELALNIDMEDEQYQIELLLEQCFIHQKAGFFSIDGLSGNFAWTNGNKVLNSTLQWQDASLYAIALGGAAIEAKVQNSHLSLLSPLSLPILDGQLNLSDFNLQRLEDDSFQWDFAAELEPISMESLSLALEWPLLHGKLSGQIPKVTYADQQIKVEGDLTVNLFQGHTIINDLQLDHAFGALPQLQANIILKDLDLATLTQTFDFGEITGKLDGSLVNLRLANWQPVQFDASFFTPKADKSRRKISQEAVDSLSQIGGGASGLLQRSFLRFFKNFSYQKLGLNCKLRNDVCEMSGVEEAKQGYYIVKGGGLPPRINVIGYTRRVNWPDLIDSLKGLSQSPGPVIK